MNTSSLNILSDKHIDAFLCAVLRGEPSLWPFSAHGEIESGTKLFLRMRHHGVQALVFDCLSRNGELEAWPAGLSDRLRDAVKMTVAFDLLRSREEINLLAEFKKLGIPVLLTKGAALSYTHYSKSWLRERCDADCLIRPTDIKKTLRALLAFGYQVMGPVYKSHQFGASKKFGRFRAANFDIHWRVLNAPRFARVISFHEAMSQSVLLPDVDDVLTLNPIYSLLLACAHRKGSTFHDENRLIWLYDIHLLMSSMAQKDMEQFARIAVVKNIQAACQDGLQKAGGCFNTRIPPGVLELLSAPELPNTLKQRFRNSYLGLFVNDLRCLPDVASRVALIGELLFPSADSLLRKYGKSSRGWLPLLWLRQILGGMAQRLTLR